jgi:hypothetical protein
VILRGMSKRLLSQFPRSSNVMDEKVEPTTNQ